MRANSMLLLAVAMSLPLSAQAHRQWLLPSDTQVDAKEAWVTIDGAVSENLFDLDSNALALDGLKVIDPSGAAVEPQNLSKSKMRSSFDLRLQQLGTYKISVVSQNVMANYTLNGEQKRWRGTEEKMAQEVPADAKDLKVSRTYGRLETFVSSGKPSDKVLEASGQGLEIVPLSNPTEQFASESSSFRVLLDGKPLADQVVSVIPGGVRYRGVLNEQAVTTNAKGEFSVKWPFAGMYWLNASYPKREEMSADGKRPDAPAKRYTYAATLEVLPQ